VKVQALLSALICGIIVLTGCAMHPQAQPAGIGTSPESVERTPFYPREAVSIGIDREALAGMADRVDGAVAVGARLGRGLSFGGMREESRPAAFWVSKPGFNGPAFALVELADGSLVEITVCSDARSAREYAAIELDRERSSQAAHVQDVKVQSVAAEAREKLDIPPVFDKETGLALPGTGIRTGVTKISWADGRFAVKVMSATLTVAELLPIAEAVKLDVE